MRALVTGATGKVGHATARTLLAEGHEVRALVRDPDRAAEIVKEAAASGRSLREVAREKGVEDAVLDEALDYRAMAKPHDA